MAELGYAGAAASLTSPPAVAADDTAAPARPAAIVPALPAMSPPFIARADSPRFSRRSE